MSQGLTKVERDALMQALRMTGAKRPVLVKTPLAAALGAGMKIDAPRGAMVAVLAVCLLLPGGRILESQSDTRVRFGAMTQSDIRYYISTGEPMDKAGAYALQGVGGRYIERVEGSPSGVIGLPLYETRALLQSAGLLEYH